MDGATRNDVREAKLGSQDALNRLLARNHMRLLRLARSRLGPGLRGRVNTSDLLQSTYLDVVNGIGSFGGETEDTFVGWISTILLNNIRDRGRSFDSGRNQGVQAQSALDAALSGARGPGSELLLKEDLRMAQLALDALSDEFRTILRLRLREGKSHREAAADMGRPEPSVRVLLSRARIALALEYERLRNRSGPG